MNARLNEIKNIESKEQKDFFIPKMISCHMLSFFVMFTIYVSQNEVCAFLVYPPMKSSAKTWQRSKHYERGISDTDISRKESLYNHNGLSNQNPLPKKKQLGGIFIPNEILYPSSMNDRWFFNDVQDKKANTNDKKNNDGGDKDDIGVPLYAAIQTLSDSLEKIVDKNSLFSLNIKNYLDGGNQLISMNSNDITIRIDQLLQHTNADAVDPLLWLRQHQCLRSRSAKLDIFPPSVYFADSQNSLEIAGYGTSGSFQLSGDYQMTSSDWDIISSLPSGVKVYGGSRFDPLLPLHKRGKEWQKDGTGFRGYFYMLPTVELRKENNQTYLSLNIHGNINDLPKAAEEAMILLNNFCPSSFPNLKSSKPPNLPPILYRNEETPTQEEWERGIYATLNSVKKTKRKENEHDHNLENLPLEKTVLSRKLDLFFSDHDCNFRKSPIDILWRMKLVGHVGHFFYLQPSEESGSFWGCTPERLFQIDTSGKILSEALAGTRPRGADTSADAALTSELLFSSPKDMKENTITKRYILDVFKSLRKQNLIQISNKDFEGKPFIRLMRNLQHICQTVRAQLNPSAEVSEVVRALLENLHPTPAVCGFPKDPALEIIRKYETYDRGYYAGPFGYIGSDSADVVVAIRSSLLQSSSTSSYQGNRINKESVKLSVYAGAGIVEGSSPQGEWTETSHKHGTISSLFSSAPLTLSQSPTANAAFSTVFVEELIRCGITMFYVCPGSRSTPLTAAIAKANKNPKNLGVVRAISVHDERGAAYRAIGFARRTGRPAVVVTSSGSAVGNLFPAVMEANEDGVPLLLLTADRPYEARGTGANQSVDQIKAYGSHVRWFRDISPPSDDATVSISLALSDANHAISMANSLLGPVHVNIQFRENLAPEAGTIRGDDRIDSLSRFNSKRYTDVPGFHRWASSGSPWQRSYNRGLTVSTSLVDPIALHDVVSLIMNSQRGMIVVGNLRIMESGGNDQSSLADMISHFASKIGFPVFASIMSGSLRNSEHRAVIPCAEHLLKNKKVAERIKPDLILQIGSPIVSTEISNLIKSEMRENDMSSFVLNGSKDILDKEYTNDIGDSFEKTTTHVLLHPHATTERADPDFTATHVISAPIDEFLKAVLSEINYLTKRNKVQFGSKLSPLVLVGRMIRSKMPEIINEASKVVLESAQDESFSESYLTEPQVVLAISEVLQEEEMQESSLFISNSMPVRDAEFFMYANQNEKYAKQGQEISCVGVNRGASGIDGIISSATGYMDGYSSKNCAQKKKELQSASKTTLLIGDLATLHDINAFHSVSRELKPGHASSHQNNHTLTTVIVNNNGGGIFSFLPIARHENEVGFEDFFGTSTDSFSFEKGAAAFGLPYVSASSFEIFKEAYRTSIKSNNPNLVEAKVVSRSLNVQVHNEVTKRSINIVDEILSCDSDFNLFKCDTTNQIYDKYIGRKQSASPSKNLANINDKKTVVLLHGWMGEKIDWKETATLMTNELGANWKLIAIDLPGHGESSMIASSQSHIIKKVLDFDQNLSLNSKFIPDISINDIAQAVLDSLYHMNITSIESLCGYSLGGRIALAMNRICATSSDKKYRSMLTKETKFVILSANPGLIENSVSQKEYTNELESRIKVDETLAASIMDLSYRSYLQSLSYPSKVAHWGTFLSKWYGAKLWGELQNNNSVSYREMIKRRINHLSRRALDLAVILKSCSPPLNPTTDWKSVVAKNTLFLSGKLDDKYSAIGKQWKVSVPELNLKEIPNAGHAILVEEPEEVARLVTNFLLGKSMEVKYSDTIVSTDFSNNESAIFEPNVKSKSNQERKSSDSTKYTNTSFVNESNIGKNKNLYEGKLTASEYIPLLVSPVTLDYEIFTIDILTDNGKTKGVSGIGWGKAASDDEEHRLNQRKGYIIEIISNEGATIGVGEISPLPGLHLETFDEVGEQLKSCKEVFRSTIPKFDATSILKLDGSLQKYLDIISCKIAQFNRDQTKLYPSVRSGFEMAFLALASQAIRQPLPSALISTFSEKLPGTELKAPSMLKLNGLATRGTTISPFGKTSSGSSDTPISYSSLKVKIGHQSIEQDVNAIFEAVSCLKSVNLDNNRHQIVRADANRGWNTTTAMSFAVAINELGADSIKHIEFIEEPLQQVTNGTQAWNIEDQLKALEEWHEETTLFYALDETMADIAVSCNYDFNCISKLLCDAIRKTKARGCAAFILKPSLLGLELSMRIAKIARKDLGIKAVFSSSFDSGVGLAYCAFIAASTEAITPLNLSHAVYPHGLATFGMLRADTLTPSFGSYVNDKGVLNVASLGRGLYGLGLDEMRENLMTEFDSIVDENLPQLQAQQITSYQAVSSTSSSGREINVQVSLPLPFSHKKACETFTDLPQQSRWSPWISSVEYIPAQGETEWTLNVRGFQFRWRAKSTILDNPKGIRWESVSGVKNQGYVVFIPTSKTTCVISVKMQIFTPRLLTSLFRGTPIFVEDFLQNKLLKWSLEMFRDIVKADLALERGDVELGDALFGAVEGRANAIEATLSSTNIDQK